MNLPSLVTFTMEIGAGVDVVKNERTDGNSGGSIRKNRGGGLTAAVPSKNDDWSVKE